MEYEKVKKATFLSRPNRFIAHVLLEGKEETVHVKNTGRCKELLISGTTVYLSESASPNRKTKYDLICVEKKREGKSPLLINLDSQAPNRVVEEWLPKSGLFSPSAVIFRERIYGTSRFDFFIQDGERKAFLEVKGVTLEENGSAKFPDAPTLRGIKHLEELCLASNAGYEAFVLFVLQMKEMHSFSPNDMTHKAFGDALRLAVKNGVRAIAVDCVVTPNSMNIDELIPVEL